jgi:hypothetical protein
VRLLKDPEVRVKDVARRFGVSVGTVVCSRVLRQVGDHYDTMFGVGALRSYGTDVGVGVIELTVRCSAIVRLDVCSVFAKIAFD